MRQKKCKMENVKDWLDKKGYQNSGLRTDRNHRIDLYLSDVLDEYRTELLRIHDIVGQSEQLVCDCSSETFSKYYKGDGKCGYCGGNAES